MHPHFEQFCSSGLVSKRIWSTQKRTTRTMHVCTKNQVCEDTSAWKRQLRMHKSHHKQPEKNERALILTASVVHQLS